MKCEHLDDPKKCKNYKHNDRMPEDRVECYHWKRNFLGKGEHWCGFFKVDK
jgi:hypothetical protein